MSAGPNLEQSEAELPGEDPDATIDPEISRPVEGLPSDSDPTSSMLDRLRAHAFKETRYRFKGEIARGGMGAILKVWDEDLRRTMAMKVILGTGSRGSGAATVRPRVLARFLEEAQVNGQLDHPGIVPVHELGLDHEGRVYFTMRLVKGRNLRQIFEYVHRGEEGWSRTRALMVLLKVCEAMAYAHKKGVIHRDLKPDNVMVGRFGEVYVMDWGLARVLGHRDLHDIRPDVDIGSTMLVESDRKDPTATPGTPSPVDSLFTMDGDVIGTPAYMPPEQAMGKIESIDPRSDVYALGAILYHLLTGHMPYVPAGSSVPQRMILRWVLEGPPKPVHEVQKDVPVELAAICEKAMERDPQKRYADMFEVAEDLRAYLENRVVHAYQTGALAELRKWVQRNRSLAGAIAAAVLLLAVGLATSLWLKAQADANYELARSRRDDILRLSAFQELEDLVEEGDELWPPWPHHVEAYDAWLAKAERVVAGLAPNPAEDDIGHRARLERLEGRAVERTPEELVAEERAHPRFAELQRLRDKLAAARKARAVRAGEAAVEVPELDPDALPEDFADLNDLAWRYISPEFREFGQEAEGLALARYALEFVQDEEDLARANLTLAWALFANGLDTEAREEMETAVSLAPVELRARLERSQAELQVAMDAARGLSGETSLTELEQQVAELAAEVTRHELRFEDPDDRWWYNQLTRLIDEIEGFADPETGLVEGLAPGHGWGVAQRRAWADSVEERTVTGEDVARKWAGTIALIADRKESPHYRGLELKPQIGLVPIGRDPDSGLWEFGHPLSGEVPERDDDGRLVIGEETGLVFVLVPGGESTMGAQSQTPGPNFDPGVLGYEGPPHDVTLSPYFISKYEMSQAQWVRFTGQNPSWYRNQALSPTLLHPLEQVSWLDAMNVLERMGLTLPTEAQWEHAARGGTTSVFWTGNEPETLANAANLLDRAAEDGGAPWAAGNAWRELDDGYVAHAPVDAYRANPFGLHGVHGNVWEWCFDSYDPGFYSRSPGTDPVCDPSLSRLRVMRGGAFGSLPPDARSARRAFTPLDDAGQRLGLRPARVIDASARTGRLR